MASLAQTDSRRLPGMAEFVVMIAMVMMMVALGIDSMLPALPSIGDSFAISEANQRQFVISVFMLGFGTGQIFMGMLSDRFGRRPVLLVSLGGYAVTSAIAAWSASFDLLLGARFAQGLASAGGRVLVASLVRDCFEGRKMAQVMSLASVIFMAAPVLAPAVGQLVLSFGPWQWIFGVLALFGLGMLGWVWLRLPETLARENRIPLEFGPMLESAREVLRDRQSVGYTLASALMFGGLLGFIFSVQQIFADVFGALDLLAVGFAGLAGAMALVSLLNARLVMRFGMRLLGHIGLLWMAGFALIHLAVALAGKESLVLFIVLQATMMAGFALASANFGAMAMENMGRVAGMASSLQGFTITISGALIGTAIGQQFDGTTVPMYTGYCVTAVLAILVVLWTEHGRLFTARNVPTGD